MMELKIEEYLNQLDNEIVKLERRLADARKELSKNINKDLIMIVDFGYAKYTENITKIAAQLLVLTDQRETFKYIFKVEE